MHLQQTMVLGLERPGRNGSDTKSPWIPYGSSHAIFTEDDLESDGGSVHSDAWRKLIFIGICLNLYLKFCGLQILQVLAGKG